MLHLPTNRPTWRRWAALAAWRRRHSGSCAGICARLLNWSLLCPSFQLTCHGLQAQGSQGWGGQARCLQRRAQQPAHAIGAAARYPSSSAHLVAADSEVRGCRPCSLRALLLPRHPVRTRSTRLLPPTRLGPRPPPLPPPYSPHPALPTRTPCRVHAGQVCRAWREATLSPALWSHLYFRLPRDDDEETAEAFVSWLLPRVGQVETLHIDIQDVAQVGVGKVGILEGECFCKSGGRGPCF